MSRCGKCAGCRRMVVTGDMSAECLLQRRVTGFRETTPHDPEGDYARMIERLRVGIRRRGRKIA